MAKIENISTLEGSQSVVSVTLRENRMLNNGSYYTTVSRNTASFRSILAEIAEDNTGVDPFMLQYAAVLIQKKILKMLEQGKAVNVLDLGTIYIGMRCIAKGKSDVREKGNFYIKFTPTSIANAALESLAVDKVVFAESAPEITEVLNLMPDAEPDTLTPAGALRIRGSRLKVGGEGSGVFFVPADTDGRPVTDETLWIRLADNSLFRNKPTELNLFVPATLDAGTQYFILIRTFHITANTTRKSPAEVYAGAFTVTQV